MVRDPKQWLLLHVEKVVLVVMLLLLVLVLFVYHPWSIQEVKGAQISIKVEQGEEIIRGDVWTPPLVAPDHKSRFARVRKTPWDESATPTRHASKLAGLYWFGKVITEKKVVLPPPVVLAAKRIFAKAEKGEVLIVFELDDQAERAELGRLDVTEYEEGLPFVRIEIKRIDKRTGTSETITPKDWLPEGLPRHYGAPADDAGAAAPVRFAAPVYFFSQRERADDARMQEDMRRRDEAMRRERAAREKEFRRRAEAERRLMELERLEDERRGGERGPDGRSRRPRTTRPRTTRRPRTTTTTTRRTDRRTRRKTVVTAPPRIYWFVDKNVAAGTEYEYKVIIYCENPAFRHPQATGHTRVVASPAISSSSGGKILTQRVTKWYFQGGSVTRDVQLGTFKVRCFVGGSKGLSNDDINRIIDEFLNPVDPAAGRKPDKKPEVSGLWVERNFQVRPGEEIGRKVRMDVDGEQREVDFSTGCCLVSIQNEVQVLEAKSERVIPGPDGRPVSVEQIRRIVNASKLRCYYTDVGGVLQIRWQQPAPAISREPRPE